VRDVARRQPWKKPPCADVGVWTDAVCDAIDKDRSELVDMLRRVDPAGRVNDVTPDLCEFIAWLLDEKPDHRPPLPEKFSTLYRIHSKTFRTLDRITRIKDKNGRYKNKKIYRTHSGSLFDMMIEFKDAQVRWKRDHPGEKFPYEETVARISGGKISSKRFEALRTELKRSSGSSRRVLPP
jgi:hypothetical protein